MQPAVSVFSAFPPPWDISGLVLTTLTEVSFVSRVLGSPVSLLCICVAPEGQKWVEAAGSFLGTFPMMRDDDYLILGHQASSGVLGPETLSRYSSCQIPTPYLLIYRF